MRRRQLTIPQFRMGNLLRETALPEGTPMGEMIVVHNDAGKIVYAGPERREFPRFRCDDE